MQWSKIGLIFVQRVMAWLIPRYSGVTVIYMQHNNDSQKSTPRKPKWFWKICSDNRLVTLTIS